MHKKLTPLQLIKDYKEAVKSTDLFRATSVQEQQYLINILYHWGIESIKFIACLWSCKLLNKICHFGDEAFLVLEGTHCKVGAPGEHNKLQIVAKGKDRKEPRLPSP